MTLTTWALIPCSKTKADRTCSAREMYWPSQQFKSAWKVAEVMRARVLIFSAKYGPLWPEQMIEPYDVTLSGARLLVRERWAADVIMKLGLAVPDDHLATIKPGDRVVSFLPQAYGEILHRVLRENGVEVAEPLKGLGQGKRLSWFKVQLLLSHTSAS